MEALVIVRRFLLADLVIQVYVVCGLVHQIDPVSFEKVPNILQFVLVVVFCFCVLGGGGRGGGGREGVHSVRFYTTRWYFSKCCSSFIGLLSFEKVLVAPSGWSAWDWPTVIYGGARCFLLADLVIQVYVVCRLVHQIDSVLFEKVSDILQFLGG